MTTWSEVENTLAELKRLAERTAHATFHDVHVHLDRMMAYIDNTPLLKEYIASCSGTTSEQQVVENISAFLKSWGKTPLAIGNDSKSEVAFLYCAFNFLRYESNPILQIGYILSNVNHGDAMVSAFGEKLVVPFYEDIAEHFRQHRNDFTREEPSGISPPQPSKKTYAHDVFISHASADKSKFVDALYSELKRLEIDIWYDSNKEVLDWGDSLNQQIAKGLETCRFGIVVLSKDFFGRKWPERELTDLLTRQNESGEKVVLPLLYHVPVEEMIERYPVLEDVKARSVEDGEDPRDIVIDFARVLIKALKPESQA